MDIEVKKLTSGDLVRFVDLIRVFEEVFEMQQFKIPPHDHLQRLLETEGFMVFVASHDNKVVGGLTAYTLQQYYSVRPLAYIYDLAVVGSLQRQGIGKQLIVALNKFCKDEGMEEVFVQADEEDTHALDFYRSTGAIAAPVVHFYYPLTGKD